MVPEIRAISISKRQGCWDGHPPATGQLLLPAQLIGWQVAWRMQVCLSQEEEERRHQVSLYPGPEMKRLVRNENKSCTYTHTHTPTHTRARAYTHAHTYFPFPITNKHARIHRHLSAFAHTQRCQNKHMRTHTVSVLFCLIHTH